MMWIPATCLALTLGVLGPMAYMEGKKVDAIAECYKASSTNHSLKCPEVK